MSARRTTLASLLLAAGLTAGLAAGLAAPPAGARAEEPVTLFAAASLTTVTGDLADAYGAAGDELPRGVFASSSTLAKQIEQGAPADLYLSANPSWMDYLEERGLIVPGSRVELLANRLVLVAPLDSPLGSFEIGLGFALAETLDRDHEGARLVLGDPAHVPAGLYAKAALESLGIWDSVADRSANAADVRAALALVERGAAAAGIVYASDALISSRVKVLATFPETSHPAIRYPVAIVAGRDRPEVRAFYDYLLGAKAAELFRGRGFTPLPPSG
jgi:molybdate transport system substrate-binding protein